MDSFEGIRTGVARLSSARVVRCRVKSHNERNPYHLLYFSDETARVSERKVGTTSSQRGPYILGNTRATMVKTKSCNLATGS